MLATLGRLSRGLCTLGSVSMGRQQTDKTLSGQGSLEDHIQVTPHLRENIL